MALGEKKKLERLKKQIAVQQEMQRIDRLKTWYYVLVTPAAIVALIYWDAYAKHTFIPLKDFLLIGAAAGVPLSLPCLKILRGYVLVLMVFIGCIFALLFLLVNQAYARDAVSEIKKPVVKKWHWGKYSRPRVDVLFEDETTTFYVEEKALEHSNYVTLIIKQGYFGYAFIDDYTLSAE